MAALTIEFPQTVWTVEFGGDGIVVAEVTMTGGSGLELGETSSTAYRGDRGKTAYDHSQLVTGNPHGTTAADVGADPAGTAAGLVDDLSGVSNQATARTNLGLGTAAVTDTGTGSSNVILGNDARLTDSRTPTSHNHAASEITSGTIDQARLGTGSAGAGAKFLADDQTYKTPSGGSVAGVLHIPGSLYSLGGTVASATAVMPDVAGQLVAHPVWLPAGSYDRVHVVTTASGTATYRIGIYNHNPSTLHPDGQSLIVDCGTINMAVTAGLLSTAASFTIPTSGVYWAAVLVDAYTSRPSGFGWNGTVSAVPILPWSGSLLYGFPGGRQTWARSVTGISTGAMPSTYPASFQSDTNIPQIGIRAA